MYPLERFVVIFVAVSPFPWGETFRTQYDCLHFGYEESQKKLEEIGREEVNKYGIYIRFTCTPDPSI